MVWVKICGITRKEDAVVAVDAGADALGFNFYKASPRYIEPNLARDIISALPGSVMPVGLFVDAPLEEVRETAELLGLRTVQLHGVESPEYCRELRLEVIKAVRVRGPESLDGLKDYDVKAFLLDAYSSDLAGGTGRTFDYDVVSKAKATGRPIIVAGGLTPETVSFVVEKTRPYGVDVASGVESAPGLKDAPKVRAFIERAKATDVEAIHET